MTPPANATHRLRPRKEPQQERSRQMRARIIEATVRVLDEDGALGLTTTKVADEAGISVGSLYQYFPNKHALVIAIHDDAVRQSWQHVQAILDDPARQARQKILDIAKWFFDTESSEAARLGPVFDDIEMFLRHTSEDNPLEQQVASRFEQFLTSATPTPRTAQQAEFDTHLLMTTLEAVGKAVASRPLSPTARENWAVATAAMLCDFLEIDEG